MRTFYDALEMIKEVERDLAEMGIRYQSATVQDKQVENDPGYMTTELQAYGYTLYPRDNLFINLEEMLGYNQSETYVRWVKAEAGERIYPFGSQYNPGKSWKIREDFWQPYLRNRHFSYSYIERWQEQLRYVLNELQLRPNTRQAVMTMYDRHQDMMNWGGLDRVPCSLTYHFLIRVNKIHLIYSQRSCDFLKFFQSDVYCTITLLQFMSQRLKIELGGFTHIINSLHAFAKDMEGVF